MKPGEQLQEEGKYSKIGNLHIMLMQALLGLHWGPGCCHHPITLSRKAFWETSGNGHYYQLLQVWSFPALSKTPVKNWSFILTISESGENPKCPLFSQYTYWMKILWTLHLLLTFAGYKYQLNWHIKHRKTTVITILHSFIVWHSTCSYCYWKY